MKKNVILILFIFFILSCKTYNEKEFKINSEHYELLVPEKHKELLILFPSFGGNNESVKNESNLVNYALENRISILIFKINTSLFFDSKGKLNFSKLTSMIIKENNLNPNKIYLGGFSAGGNLALQLGKSFTESNSKISNPKGIFVVDSPVDLLKLYQNSKKRAQIEKPEANSESDFIIEYLEVMIGKPERDIELFKEFSPYLDTLKYIENVKFKDTKLLFYTEPARKFNLLNYNRTFEETNSYQIKNLHNELKKNGLISKYIETENKGYRKNGNRNPHSWSIIDEKEIIDWIKK